MEWADSSGILDVDGNVNAWGLYWRLASGSTVFKVESEYVNSYTEYAVPYAHYIPIAKNLSDFEEQTKLVTNEDSRPKLNRIAHNSRRLMFNHTYKQQVERVAMELASVWDPNSVNPLQRQRDAHHRRRPHQRNTHTRGSWGPGEEGRKAVLLSIYRLLEKVQEKAHIW